MQSKDDRMLVVQEMILDPSLKGKLTATLPDSPDHVITRGPKTFKEKVVAVQQNSDDYVMDQDCNSPLENTVFIIHPDSHDYRSSTLL